jgi:LysM repeat protein
MTRSTSAAGTTLATVARAAGAKTEVVEALNPSLLRSRTPPERGTTRVRVPDRTARSTPRTSTRRAHATRSRRWCCVSARRWTTSRAARGVAVRELRRLNGVKDRPSCAPGRRSSCRPRGAARGEQGQGPRQGREPGKDEDARGDARGQAARPATTTPCWWRCPIARSATTGRERVFYRARDGDSLDEIADAFGVRSDELVEWNNVDPSAKLHPTHGAADLRAQGLRPRGRDAAGSAQGPGRDAGLGGVPASSRPRAAGRSASTTPAKDGDTLAKLGRRYGLTPGDLARINRFSYNTELHEGDRIVVYSPTGDAPHERTMGMDAGQEAPERGATARRARASERRAPNAQEEAATTRSQGRSPRPVRSRPSQAGAQGGQDSKPTGRRQDRRQEEVAARSPAMARARIPPEAAGQRSITPWRRRARAERRGGAAAAAGGRGAHRRAAAAQGGKVAAREAGATHRDRRRRAGAGRVGARSARRSRPTAPGGVGAVRGRGAGRDREAGRDAVASARAGQLGTGANAIVARFPSARRRRPIRARAAWSTGWTPGPAACWSRRAAPRVWPSCARR